MQSSQKIAITVLVAIVAVLAAVAFFMIDDVRISPAGGGSAGQEAIGITDRWKFRQLDTDLNQHSVSLDAIVSGGPGKDGIPAINEPQFVSVSESQTADDVRGIYLALNGSERFYPYTILVWHEIVNDTFGAQPVAITFCPLCGSAIVYDRRVAGDTLTFGVSGLLFESNLLMYDDATESLWSQARGEAVAGDFTGTELTRVPFQLLTFGEVKNKFPQADVLSTNTGYNRDYTLYPYGNYDETEELYFPVSVSDERFSAKEIMYVVPVGDTSLAFPKDALADGARATTLVNGQEVIAMRDGGEITVTINGERAPGYFEMWFSWATHHQDDGEVWRI